MSEQNFIDEIHFDFTQISKYSSSKCFSLKMSNKEFNLIPEQLFFIAPYLLKNNFETSFEIDDDSASLSNCFEMILSLFQNQKEILIQPDLSQSFLSLAELFGNENLMQICLEVENSQKPSSYKLSLASLFQVEQSILEKYETFTIKIDGKVFKVNPILMSIISKRVEELFIEGENELILSTPEGVDPTEFKSLMNDICFMFRGSSLDLFKYLIFVVESLKESLEIEKFQNHIDFRKKSTFSLQEAIFIFQKCNIRDINDVVIDLVASSFDQVLENQNLKNQIEKFSVEKLDKILSSNNLKKSSEEILFDFLLNQKKIDLNFGNLLKHVQFRFVSREKLKEYFEAPAKSFSKEEVKKMIGMFSEFVIIHKFKEIDKKRYTKPVFSASEEEVNKIFETLDKNNPYNVTANQVLDQLISDKVKIQKEEEKIKKHCSSLVDLGMRFIKKQKRSDEDWKNAVLYFKIAFDAGDFEGKWRYARCLICGWGIEADETVGFHLLQEIKDASPITKFFYSICFPNEHEERLKILQELMDKGDPNGFWIMGIVRYERRAAKEKEEGRKLLEKAANLKRRSYMEQLSSYIQNGSYGFKKDMRKVNYYLNEVSNLPYLDEEFFYFKTNDDDGGANHQNIMYGSPRKIPRFAVF